MSMKNINSLGQKIISDGNINQLRNFWRWFGDSKVVDDQGDPLVVFHGSKTQFNTFDNSVNQDKERQMGAEFGFFFTDDITVARRFLNPNDSKNEYMQLRNDVFKNKDNFDAAQDINSYIKNLEFEKKYGGVSDADYEYCIKDVQDNINELCSLTGKNWNEMIEAIDLLRNMEQNIRDEQDENDKTLYQCYLKIENPKYYSGEIIMWNNQLCYVWDRYDCGLASEIETNYDYECKILTNSLNLTLPFKPTSPEFVASLTAADNDVDYYIKLVADESEYDSNYYGDRYTRILPGKYRGLRILKIDYE